mmetsp:Transcript_69216/g.136074  ORF Transcript_69216/g.136074 Transcript_69216/m.136074 type:complete len:335 (-) Transcript_69216:100-1104(-)
MCVNSETVSSAIGLNRENRSSGSTSSPDAKSVLRLLFSPRILLPLLLPLGLQVSRREPGQRCNVLQVKLLHGERKPGNVHQRTRRNARVRLLLRLLLFGLLRGRHRRHCRAAVQRRSGLEVVLEPFRVEGRRHHHQFQRLQEAVAVVAVGGGGYSLGQDGSAQSGQQEVGVQVAFVHLVHDEVGDVCEQGVTAQALQQNPRRAEEQLAARSAHFAVPTHHVPDSTARRPNGHARGLLPQLFRHAAGHSDGRDAPRLAHHHFQPPASLAVARLQLAERQVLLQEKLRNLRCFPAARAATHKHHCVLVHGLQHCVPRLECRQRPPTRHHGVRHTGG